MYLKSIKYLWSGFFGSIIFIFFLITSVSNNLWDLYGGLPDLKTLENPKSELASELYSEDSVLLGKYFRENRSNVNYKDISPNMINALKATEDIRFEKHSGVDLISLIRVATGIVTFNLQGGGSTISQQLAKNLFKTRTELNEGKLNKTHIFGKIIIKIKEWIVAVKIECSYTKKEIVTMYLNTVDFGSNSFGIKVAANTFFKVSQGNLNVQQAAVLVGLLKAPSYYSPIANRANSLKRRNTVLGQMYRYKHLNKSEYDSIKALPLDVSSYNVESHNSGVATYFRAEVKKELLAWCKKEGFDLFADGLKVYTTINSTMQKYAKESLEKHMKKQQKLFFDHWKGQNPWVIKVDNKFKELPGFLKRVIKRTKHYRVLKLKYGADTLAINKALNVPHSMKVFTWDSPFYEKDTVLSPFDSLAYYKHFLQAGMMSMDPHTGSVKAWVGGINHKYFKYDHVRQGIRQPGSTFKPFVYATAIAEKYMHPCFQVLDAPSSYKLADGTFWIPKNSGSYTGQYYTLRQAMARSINTIAAYVIKEVTPDLVAKKANEELGFTSNIVPVYSLSLGSSDVSVYELVGAYGSFVNKGVWTKPSFIKEIRDKNERLLQKFVPETREVWDEETAYLMTYMLRGGTEEKGGTSLGLMKYDFVKDNEVGGKTGTTSNYSDAWYIGVTKDLITGIWVGGDDRGIHFKTISLGQGSRLAMPAYAAYTQKVFNDTTLNYTKGHFPMPARKLSIELDCKKYNIKINPNDSTNMNFDRQFDISPTLDSKEWN